MTALLQVRDVEKSFGGVHAVRGVSFDVNEGEASLFRPDNGSYKLIARVQMEEWSHIAAAAK